MTDGDVDMQANPGGLPTSVFDSSTLYLGDDERDPLAQEMNRCSKAYDWSGQMKKDTIESWKVLLVTALLPLTEKLASSSVMSKVFGQLTWREAVDKVNDFNEEQLNKWKEAVRSGVEMGDWTDLINLSMCLSDCPLVFVFKQCNSKGQKSKTAECSPRRSYRTSCVSFVSL